MAPKRGDVFESNSYEDWEQLSQLSGLLVVVDIYPRWAGPCEAMAPIIKKFRSQVQVATGIDSLRYVTACSDSVPQLSMFKGTCKPTFLFLIEGEAVAVHHGANSSQVFGIIMDVLKKEESGEKRTAISLEEAVPKINKEEE